MPVEIRVPQLGESVVEATVTRWLKKEGDTVAAGEPVVELETDKVNVEVPAEGDGVLQSISQAEGQTVAVGDLLALVGEATISATNGAVPSTPAPPDADAHASPLAQRVAAEHGVSVSDIPGSGPGGRVSKDDVASYLERSADRPATASALAQQSVERTPAPPAPNNGAAKVDGPSRPEERVRMTRRRQTIATRLVEAQHTAAMLTTFNEIDMSAMLALRARRKDAFKERHGIGLGFMSFFSKAAIGALKAFPYLNAEIQGTEIVVKRYYDIGIAVSTGEGLVVPVIRDADRKTFAEIEREIGDLATRARDGKLTLAELQGGTFTITNGGTFGSMMSTPILNAPQVGILGMHKTEDRPVAVNGQVVIKPMMYVALSYDHRIVDGSEAVRFLVRVKELVEDPESLLLEG